LTKTLKNRILIAKMQEQRAKENRKSCAELNRHSFDDRPVANILIDLMRSAIFPMPFTY